MRRKPLLCGLLAEQYPRSETHLSVHIRLKMGILEVSAWEGQLLLPPIQARGAEVCCAGVFQKMLWSLHQD